MTENNLTQEIYHVLQEQLTDLSKLHIQEFAYRQFLSNGTTIGFATRNISPTQGQNLNYQFLQRFYYQATHNNLVVYKRNKEQIEGFYFLAASNNSDLIKSYLKHFTYFEHLVNFVSTQINALLDRLQEKHLFVSIFSQNSLLELFSKNKK